jgi:4-hydroxybenzoyl-CoA thioesterase
MAPFVHSFPVRFDDVDHANIVYYPRFLHYFHVAFEEFFRARMGAGAYLDLISRRKIGFPAVRAECDYRAPLRFGDTVRVEVSITRLGGGPTGSSPEAGRSDPGPAIRWGKSVRFAYRATREEGPGGPEAVAAEGIVVCAVTDLAHFRAIEVPEDLRQLFLELVVNPG